MSLFNLTKPATPANAGVGLFHTLEDHAKIDDNVHVGHNVQTAKGPGVTAGVVISGSESDQPAYFRRREAARS